MKTNFKTVLALSLSAALLVLQGCATPTVVQTKQTGDASLSCADLQKQIDEARDFELKARKERTVTGTNVAAAILFWPALLGTYANTEEAINAAKERQANLTKIADGKKCAFN